MALSTRLIRRLEGDGSDEPLAKRLKLAKSVLFSSDTLIFRKEDSIFRWLCGELSEKSDSEIWLTLHRCLALDPKNFSRLSPTTKNLLIEKLKNVLKGFPDNPVLEEMVKCGSYVFSSAGTQNYSKEDNLLDLMEALLEFASKTLIFDNGDKSVKSEVILECTECAVNSFAQSCRQSFSEKKNFMAIFIDKLLFPLSSLVKIIQNKNLSSKMFMETQKCIKRLLLGSIKNITLSTGEENKKVEEAEALFSFLKDKVNTMKIDSVKTAFTCLFQSVLSIFQQNSSLIDVILRKLVNCTESKEQSKQILTALIENSIDVSYNFDHEIDGISLKAFLKTQVEDIVAKKKNLKCLDYELLTAVSKLNPLIVEDVTQSILERILFEKKKSESEEVAQEILIKELWKASVRLRRQQKFLSKFLLTISSTKDKDSEDLETINEFELPKSFAVDFSEDLKSKSSSAQILAIFHTLIYHLKSDCINNVQNTILTAEGCLMMKIVTKFLVIFFESSNFLDSSLPRDWQVKFYTAFSDLRNHLATFAENLCEEDNFKPEAFFAFSDIVKTWCEAYDLLRYYLPNDVASALSFPVEDAQLNELKQIVKKCKDSNCKVSLNKLLLFESVIYNKGNHEPIKEKMIKQLWSLILTNHFEIIESFDEKQILELTLHLVDEACSSQDKLLEWTSLLKQNISRMTKKFATAAVLQVTINMVEHVDSSTSKAITEKIDFASVLQSLDDPASLKNVLKKAKKEFSKQNFKSLDTVDIDKVKRNLMFLSNLPLSFLDTEVRTFLFLVLYTFEEEIKNNFDVQGLFTNLHLDFLRQNDINILDCISQPSVLINHFKENQLVLMKIVKLSLSSLPALEFWEKFVKTEECNKKISSILLICIDSYKSKAPSNEHKSVLHNLSLKLSTRITKGLKDNISDPYEIAGLRISLKIILVEKKELKDNLKKFVESIMKNIVQIMENTSHEKLVQEVLQLSLHVLSNREYFDIDEDVVQKLCIALIKNPDEKIFSHFLEVLKDTEFDYFAKSLSNRTKDILISGNIEALEKAIVIWECLSRAETKASRSKSIQSSVKTYFNELLCTEINEASPVFLLKICRAIVTSKRMIQLSGEIIDSVVVVSTQCLDKLSRNQLQTCREALGLGLDFLRSKSDFLPDRLFAFTSLFCKIVQAVLQEGKDTDFADEQTLRILAVDIEKFCTFFAKLKKDVARISSYLIADLIEISSRVGVLPTYLKTSLDSAIAHLLSNCDQYAISFLSRTLPVSTQQVFKTIYNNYTKYHKFTGKI